MIPTMFQPGEAYIQPWTVNVSWGKNCCKQVGLVFVGKVLGLCLGFLIVSMHQANI